MFSLTAALDGQKAVAYGTKVAAGSKGFTVSLGSLSVINLAAGQTSQQYPIVATSINGYSGTLTLQCLGMPSLSQCQLGPPTLPLYPGGEDGGSVIFSVASGMALGSYPFKIRASDGATNFDIPLTLNVGDFTMAIGPAVQQAFPTDTATYTLTLTSVDNYVGDVSITCSGFLRERRAPVHTAIFLRRVVPLAHCQSARNQ